MSIVFGGISLQIVLLMAAVVLAALLLLVGGGLLAALAEAELVRIVATDEETVAGIADARLADVVPLAAEDDGPVPTPSSTGAQPAAIEIAAAASRSRSASSPRG